MNVRLIFLFVFLLITAPMASYAQNVSMANGLNWLSVNQNADGSWGANATTTVVDTTTVINAKMNFGNDASIQNTATWLIAQEVDTVDELSRKVISLTYSGTDTSSLISVLINARNSENGWGYKAGYSSTPLDTSLALQALKSANYSDYTTINPALAYLTTSQNPDGGWGFAKGDPSTGSGQADSNVYLTAIVSSTLQQFPQMTTIATAVNKATTYLLAQQNPDGGFGASSAVYETALAFIALVGNGAGAQQAAPLQNAVNYIIATQSANGSWNDDPYSTALALKALYLSENKPSPPPPPPAGGKITGTVIDKVTGQKVAGVVVVLDSNQLINATTDSSGSFTLSDIPAGSQKVNFSLTGYATTNATATVVVDTTVSLGTIPMTSSYSTGTITGTITDSTGKPMTGVAITVTGAWSGSSTTGADGTYSFTYVTPGSVTISAAKTGFQTVTAPGTVYARTTLTFSPRMSATASQLTTGTLVGRVVDSYWGVPIGHLPEEKGVRVFVPGMSPVDVEPEGGGYFTIPDLAPGTYQVIVGMLGFQTFRVVITAGGTTDLGTIRLEMSMLMALTGKITDASTGAPIPGAEVTFSGKDLNGRADFAGTYAITGIPTPGEYTVKASADGYVGKSYTVGSSPWLHTMDFALSPRITKGSLTGSVIDAATSQPLAGVTLTLESDHAVSTTTDSAGTFTLNAVSQGPQQVSLALGGYTSRILTTAIIAGAVNNVGMLPLSTTPLPATIQGTVRDVVANGPFADVTIQATGTTPLQTITAADGTYKLDNVTPGTVTVAASAPSKPGYGSARFTATLEPGGILVFSPALSTTLPGSASTTVQTNKLVYIKGETVAISANLQNRQATDLATALHLRVTDPSGATVYETDTQQNLTADGTLDLNFSFALPADSLAGAYMVVSEVYNANGVMIGVSSKNFGVTVSQIAITPALPAVFTAGANTVTFNLVNSGTLAVSNGVIGVTLKDPDGQIVSTVSQNFSLGLGENKSLATTLSIPSLKFGAYTLTYLQSDETKAGATTDILLPNTLTITAIYDDTSHRIRGTANLTVTLRNTGRFNLDAGSASQAVSLTAAVPDAAYSETKPLSPAPAVGNTSGSVMIYQFAIPETMTAGQHGTRITVTLPSGSTTVQTAQLAILESSLSLSPLQPAFTAGDTIRPVIANSGGLDTPVQYRLSLYDAKAALIVETANTGTAMAGSTLSPALAIPSGAVDGSYNLVVTYKDTKTGKEAAVPNGITINGVKGSIQVQTDKQNYLLTENITGLGSMTSSGTPLTGGNLHLQVTTGAGAQKTKTWTAKADFQTGVRSGVDTYGVNDWIIPDDDFSGTAIDTNKWKIGGVTRIESGRAFADSTNVGSGLESKYQLEGDFDVQVDFDSNLSAPWEGCGMSVMPLDWSFSLTLHNDPAGYYGGQIYENRIFKKDNYYAGSNDKAGRFRITRVGDTIVSYYWSGSSWVEHLRDTSMYYRAPVVVSMGSGRYLNLPESCAFDNFKVNSGRIKTENQTVDSVRLLPLNDNFDDGVFNEDRWIVYDGGKPTENAGAVRLLSSNTFPNNSAVQ